MTGPRKGPHSAGSSWPTIHRGEKQKALELGEQALSLDRSIGERSGEASVLSLMGGIYSDLEQLQKSLEFGERAALILIGNWK